MKNEKQYFFFCATTNGHQVVVSFLNHLAITCYVDTPSSHCNSIFLCTVCITFGLLFVVCLFGARFLYLNLSTFALWLEPVLNDLSHA